MAKITVVLDVDVVTDHLRVIKNFKAVQLNQQDGHKVFQSISVDEIGFELVCTNSNAEMSFIFSSKDGKKGSSLAVAAAVEGPGLSMTCKGTFSVNLRRGADDVLKNLGDALDLRLRAVVGKGGMYSRGGFTAPIKNGDFDQQSTDWKKDFPMVTQYSIK